MRETRAKRTHARTHARTRYPMSFLVLASLAEFASISSSTVTAGAAAVLDPRKVRPMATWYLLKSARTCPSSVRTGGSSICAQKSSGKPPQNKMVHRWWSPRLQDRIGWQRVIQQRRHDDGLQVSIKPQKNLTFHPTFRDGHRKTGIVLSSVLRSE